MSDDSLQPVTDALTEFWSRPTIVPPPAPTRAKAKVHTPSGSGGGSVKAPPVPQDQDAVIADLERRVREAQAKKAVEEQLIKERKIEELRAQLAMLESS